MLVSGCGLSCGESWSIRHSIDQIAGPPETDGRLSFRALGNFVLQSASSSVQKQKGRIIGDDGAALLSSLAAVSLKLTVPGWRRGLRRLPQGRQSEQLHGY